jgi:5'-nucleotidase (lipoprotein e(P4) family)
MTANENKFSNFNPSVYLRIILHNMRKIASLFIVSTFICAIHAQDSINIKQAESNVKVLPVLWHQHAAEYRALCYQAFNIATLRLEAAFKIKSSKKRAIITDLDETILDNSYSEAKLIKEGKSYTPASWKDWTNSSAATAVPGSVAFLQLAKQKGVTVFYISNRDTSDIQSTLLNLQRLQLPDADPSHMMFRTNTSSKEIRRQNVMAQYNVIMLLGDNLGDFTAIFDGKSTAERKTETDNAQKEWGKKFIVLPNSIYGEWENALYDYNRSLTPQQKDVKRKQQLIGY